MSAPPIYGTRASDSPPEELLKVKLALVPHNLQMDDNFFTFSHRGMSSNILAQPFCSYVPLRALIITILPALAASSLNSFISSKN